MDDLKLFSSLRPEEPPLLEVERAAIRTVVFRSEPAAHSDRVDSQQASSTTEPHDVAFELITPRRVGKPSASGTLVAGGHRRVVLAAAAVVALGVGGLWAATSIRKGNDPSTPGQSPDRTTACAEGAANAPRPASANPPGEYPPPRVTIDQPGWALARGADNASAAPELVVYNPACRFDGPLVSVQSLQPGTGLSLQEGEHQVDVGSGAGEVSASGDETWLTWTDAAEETWWARGWRVDEATVIAVASGITTDQSGVVTLPSVPAGFEVADRAAIAALGVYSEFEFQRDDGATVQISLYPGGELAFAERVSDDESGRSTVTLGDEEVSLLDYGDSGRYRADVKRGFWTWEFDGEPFATPDDFLDLVSAVRVIDEETWRATVPDNIVAGGAERAAAVEQLLAGVPIPDGFTVGGNKWTADRYQLITQVSGAVACAWLGQWFDATEAGDNASATAAADALATSHHWRMLREIETQGAWSESLWETADAVNGGPGAATGTGSEPPTRASTASGFGCQFD
jgi:hypothetical protein